ncbi:MAG: G5 domain-containing protein [Erysipelotrichaceae bacterium]|nr:G5 domain-containing protein [Erysipelotrichaceae bacterium]
MMKKAKEAIVSANSRTKGILAVALVYVIVMLATVSAGAVNQIEDFIPTVNIHLIDGLEDEKSYLVKQDTVTNVLDELSIELDDNDELNKDKDDIVQPDDLIKITRVETKTYTQEETIAYDTVIEGNKSSSWTKTVVQEGKDGKANVTYLVTYANGKETSTQKIKEDVIEEATDEIIRYGGISEGTTFTGKLTTYGGDCSGCGGTSASGVKLSASTGVNNSNSPYLTYNGTKYYCLAADRSIPFGTIIKITNHNLNTNSTIYGIVVDRGGAITGSHIDIFNGSETGKTYFSGGTSNNTSYEVISVGSGNANFWR